MQQRASVRGTVSVPRNAILVLALICLIAEITAVVLLMGGSDGAFPHLMYIPIILSAYYFSTNVTIICSAACGLALGPWMPKNVPLSLAQIPMSWMAIIIIIIGIICSALFHRIDYQLKEKQHAKSKTIGTCI